MKNNNKSNSQEKCEECVHRQEYYLRDQGVKANFCGACGGSIKPVSTPKTKHFCKGCGKEYQHFYIYRECVNYNHFLSDLLGLISFKGHYRDLQGELEI